MGSAHSSTHDSSSDTSKHAKKRISRADKLSAAFSKKPGTANSQDSERTDHQSTKHTGDRQGAVASAAASSTRPEQPATSQQSHSNQPAPEMPVTVPCQYRTGKTLGSGTYAIVKEAIHIHTGKYYACKVINKKLMEGREHMVRNEIAVLKRVSSGNANIVTLHDYFETAHNLYLVFDLCTGGELFDRICAKGNYYEVDAAGLVRTIFKAVKYLHDAGIVHRDLKPENLLFKTQAEDAAVMIADFGLSRIMDEDKLTLLTEICGTPGYMAPEIFKRTGHSKPVDVWAMGVITYFLLAGYTPFDRDSQQQEMEAIIAGNYKFEPEEYWENVSDTGKDFVRYCLTVDPAKRPTAAQALAHKWLADSEPHFVANPEDGTPADLLPNVKRAFDAKKLWRKAAFSIRAVNRMASLAQATDNPEAAKIRANLDQYKAESEKEDIETASITYQQQPTPRTSEFQDKGTPNSPTLQDKLANVSLKD